MGSDHMGSTIVGNGGKSLGGETITLVQFVCVHIRPSRCGEQHLTEGIRRVTKTDTVDILSQ